MIARGITNHLSAATQQRVIGRPLALLLLAAVYVATAKIGQLLAVPPGNVTAVWLPSGIILFAVLRWGPGVWPGIFLGAFVGNVSAYLPTLFSPQFVSALGAGVANGVGDCLGAVVGAWLIARYGSIRDPFRDVRGVFVFVGFGAVLGGLLSALFGVTALAVSGLVDWARYPELFATWWTGDSVGILLLTPLLLALVRGGAGRALSRETGAFALVLGSATLFSFGLLGSAAWSVGIISLLPLIMWAVFRLHGRVVFAAVVFVSAAAVISAAQDGQVFAPSLRNTALIELQLFVSILALTTYVLLGVVRERAAADRRLQGANERLDAQVAARTRALQASEGRLRALIDHLDAGVVVHAPDTSVLLANPAAGRLLGLTERDMEDRRADDPAWRFVDADGRDMELADYPVNRILGSGCAIETQLLGAIPPDGGRLRWVQVNGSPLRDADGALVEVIISFTDITEHKRSEHRLDHLAHHDALTGLPNRLLFNARLAQAIERAGRHDRGLALIFVDLDRFKLVNDRLGHQAGDALLREVAARLSAPLRARDTLARISGDELVVLLDDTDATRDIVAVVHRLMRSLAEPVRIQGEELHISASMGVSVYPADGTDAETLLHNADVAMYEAKEGGRNTFRFYTAEMTRIAVESSAIDHAIKGALEGEELRLAFQPRLDLASGSPVGLEALLRWRNPVLGEVSPLRLIEVAEQNGMIAELGDWVLHSACRQAREWLDAGLDCGRIAVSISGQQLRAMGFDEKIAAVLVETGCPAQRLELEIGEGCVMRHPQQVIGQLRRIKAMGITLVINDFGAAPSSLRDLKQLPVDKLKIDQALVHDIHEDPDDKAIVASVIALGHALGKVVVADGVETAAQAAFLRHQGCDQVQGLLYGAPEPAARARKRLARRARGREGGS